MIESLRKQIFEGAGARDMKLVTTRRVWRYKIMGLRVGANSMSRVTWYTGVQGHGIHIYSLEMRRLRSLPE